MLKQICAIVLCTIIGGFAAVASDGGAVPASPSPTPSLPPGLNAEAPELNPGVILHEFPTGGPRNQVFLRNQQDGRFAARSAVSLHHSGTPNVQPMNVAIAQSQCADCATMAIAVQVVLYRRGAPIVTPQNIAVAMNVGCARCVSIARSLQYVIPVDDPNRVPDEVRTLLRDMEAELRYFAGVKTVAELDPDEANARLTSFAARHAQLHQYLFDLMDREEAGTPSPSPTATAAPSTTASASAPATPSASAPPSTPSPSPSASPGVTAPPTPSPSPSATP